MLEEKIKTRKKKKKNEYKRRKLSAASETFFAPPTPPPFISSVLNPVNKCSIINYPCVCASTNNSTLRRTLGASSVSLLMTRRLLLDDFFSCRHDASRKKLWKIIELFTYVYIYINTYDFLPLYIYNRPTKLVSRCSGCVITLDQKSIMMISKCCYRQHPLPRTPSPRHFPAWSIFHISFAKMALSSSSFSPFWFTRPI